MARAEVQIARREVGKDLVVSLGKVFTDEIDFSLHRGDAALLSELVGLASP